MSSFRKVVRFVGIYGLFRTLFKVLGRTRFGLRLPLFKSARRCIGLVGCGQFGFSTIGYFVVFKSSFSFRRAYDIDSASQATFEKFHGLVHTEDFDDILTDPCVRYIYIASSHSSHTEYAVRALGSGKIVYIEKPVSVNVPQLTDLHNAVLESGSNVYCGYNRPHSKAVQDLKRYCQAVNEPITLAFFISGHVLSDDHWYRDPSEGTRICGNVGHWLDLTVHLLSWGQLPDFWKISILWSNDKSPDEDVSISLKSLRGDLVNIVLTARTEPFEGIAESINMQWGNVIAKIDDFRSLSVWKESSFRKIRYWPKDVGHKSAILQPFNSEVRSWREVELSTLLMLKIKDMIVSKVESSDFSFKDEYLRLLEGEK
jgi:hypothetical protein